MKTGQAPASLSYCRKTPLRGWFKVTNMLPCFLAAPSGPFSQSGATAGNGRGREKQPQTTADPTEKTNVVQRRRQGKSTAHHRKPHGKNAPRYTAKGRKIRPNTAAGTEKKHARRDAEKTVQPYHLPDSVASRAGFVDSQSVTLSTVYAGGKPLPGWLTAKLNSP